MYAYFCIFQVSTNSMHYLHDLSLKDKNERKRGSPGDTLQGDITNELLMIKNNVKLLGKVKPRG